MDDSTSTPRWKSKKLAWVLLMVANVTFASIGPTFIMFERAANAGPLTIAAWRNQLILCFLLPLLLWENRRITSQERMSWWTVDGRRSRYTKYYPVFCIVGAALGWATNLACWVVSLKFTTTVRASIFVNTHPFLLSLLYCVLRRPLARLTGFALLVCCAGLLLSEGSSLSGSEESNHDGASLFVGDMLCLVAAVGDAVYFFLAGAARKTIPNMTFTFIATAICCLVLSCVSLLVEDPDGGLFGWSVLADPLPEYLALFALAVGWLGLLASNYTVGVLDPLIVSSSTLINPALTGLLSYLAGLEDVPGPYTMGGGAVILLGLALMAYAERVQSRVGNELQEHLELTDQDHNQNLGHIEGSSNMITLASIPI